MYTLDPNGTFESALDNAFETARMRQGNAPLVFEGGSCVIVLKNGDRTEEIELRDGDASVFFYTESSRVYGNSKAKRSRMHYSITFPTGSVTINGRYNTPQISYRPSVRNGSARRR
jgi:hypothetical protein